MKLLTRRPGRMANLPTDGVTDVGPLLQAAYDAGREVSCTPGATYLLDSPVFLDNPDALSGLTISGNKARFNLGPNLPTSTWGPDPNTRWAFFPNTLRSALSGGVVTVNDSTRATGTVGALRPFIVRDLIVNGQGSSPRAFSFANRAPVTMDCVTFWQVRAGVSWWSYGDASEFRHCYMRRGSGPTGGAMVEMYQQGDGLTFIGCKQDGDGYLAKLTNNHGSTFHASLGKVRLVDCSSIKFSGFHNEGQQAGATLTEIVRSKVKFTASCFYETWTSNAAISIDDSGQTQTGSELILDATDSRQLFTAETANTVFSPLLDITPSDATKVTFRDVAGKQGASSIPWREGVQGLIRSSNTSLQAAIDSPRGQNAIASGNWTLAKAGPSWALQTERDPALFLSHRQAAAPVITQIVTTALTADSGTLTAGTIYEYAVAVQDALGNWSTASAAKSDTAGANRVLQLLLTIATPGGKVIVWRKAGTGVLTAPDAYAELAIRGGRAYLFDTGIALNGRAWKTVDVPVPNTVAATNSTVNALVLGGTVITS